VDAGAERVRAGSGRPAAHTPATWACGAGTGDEASHSHRSSSPCAAAAAGCHHERAAAADRLLQRSVAWFEALPVERRTPLTRHQYGTVLRNAGRLKDAHRVLSEIVAGDPDNLTYLGGLALVHARRGERAEAERIDARLAAFVPPHGRVGPINRAWGEHSYARAAIAAQFGRHEEAVELTPCGRSGVDESRQRRRAPSHPRRRHRPGDCPVQRRNARLKLLWSLNPSRNATSAIDTPGSLR
jgi:hypothetical protein